MSERKIRLLIITYYWPPRGGVAVHRWLKFVKYLDKALFDITIYTAKVDDFSVQDKELEKDVPDHIKVIRTKAPEPYSLLEKFQFWKKKNGQVKEDVQKLNILSDSSLKGRLINWIRSNLFIPDARMLWIKPSIRYLTTFLKDKPQDIIISNGTPHSVHMIAKKLKEKFHQPWLADFRDPWTDVDYFKELNLTRWARKKHHKYESSVLKAADVIMTVSPSWGKLFESKTSTKVEVITNGYDEDDFKDKSNFSFTDHQIVLRHIGSFNSYRNKPFFWEGIKELNLSEYTVRIELIGQVDATVRESIEVNQLQEYVLIRPEVSHNEAIELMQTADGLLLFHGLEGKIKGRIPAKIFEYIAAQRPIIAITQTGTDIANIIEETKSGIVVPFGDKQALRDSIKKLNGFTFENSMRVQYSRQQLTKRLEKILLDLT